MFKEDIFLFLAVNIFVVGWHWVICIPETNASCVEFLPYLSNDRSSSFFLVEPTSVGLHMALDISSVVEFEYSFGALRTRLHR